MRWRQGNHTGGSDLKPRKSHTILNVFLTEIKFNIGYTHFFPFETCVKKPGQKGQAYNLLSFFLFLLVDCPKTLLGCQ